MQEGNSWAEAALTHMPTATDRTAGITSEITVTPFSAIVR